MPARHTGRMSSPHSRLARWGQVLTLAAGGCGLAWLLWQWPRSPGLGIAGVVLMVFGHAGVLGLEFLILHRVRQADGTPLASHGQLLHAWAAETLQALRVFAWRQPWRSRAVADRLEGPGVSGRQGVVFVHGFMCNRGFWNPWLRRLRASERAFVAVNLEPVFGSIDEYVPILEAAVAQVRAATGKPPVLVCHSMGGLVARAWWRQQAHSDAAAHVVTIGSPHRGTWLADLGHVPSSRQMRLDSEWIRDLGRGWGPADGTRFTCWYSNCDNIVMPPSVATLPGGDNRLVCGAAHVDLAFRPQVMEATLALIERVR